MEKIWFSGCRGIFCCSIAASNWDKLAAQLTVQLHIALVATPARLGYCVCLLIIPVCLPVRQSDRERDAEKVTFQSKPVCHHLFFSVSLVCGVFSAHAVCVHLPLCALSS